MEKRISEETIRKIAMQEGTTADKIRAEMEKAILIGICRQDPDKQR